VTNTKSSQNHNITTTEMCDAAVTKVRFSTLRDDWLMTAMIR